MRQLALFDFDGTLTAKDTYMDFHRFHWGARCFWAFATAGLKGCLTANFGRDYLKEEFLTPLWRGVPKEKFLAGARRYAETRLESLLTPLPLSVFLRHIERGHEVYIVTASMKEWIEPWASKHGVPIIGTKLEESGGVLTGRLDGKNCRGPEKPKRIAQAIALNDFDKIYAYGNSAGDREMLQLAQEKVYNWDHVPFF